MRLSAVQPDGLNLHYTRAPSGHSNSDALTSGDATTSNAPATSAASATEVGIAALEL